MDNLGRLVSGTYGSLDWMVLKRGLAKCGRTTMGREALSSLEPYEELRDVERAHNAIDEVRRLREQGVLLPISQVKDVVENVARAAKGEVLSLEELFEGSKTFTALQEIEKLLQGHEEDAPTLVDIGSVVHVDPVVVLTLSRAFDMSGNLNPKTYPQLQELRKEIDRIGASITKTMDEIVRSSQYNSLLQDKFYTIRDNRFVLPVAVVNKNKVPLPHTQTRIPIPLITQSSARPLFVYDSRHISYAPGPAAWNQCHVSPHNALALPTGRRHRARAVGHGSNSVHRAAAGHRPQQQAEDGRGGAQG